MKVSNTSVIIDSDTFEPLLHVELSIPLMVMQDGQVLMTDDEFALIIGKELLLQLRDRPYDSLPRSSSD